MASQNMAAPKLFDELLLAAALIQLGVSPFDCKVTYDKDGKVLLVNKDTGKEILIGQGLEMVMSVRTTNETDPAPSRTSYTVRAK